MRSGCLCWSSSADVWVVLLPVRRSDISVWNRIRVVPTIYFYDEGAVVSFAARPEPAVVLGWRTHLHCPQGSSALCTGCGAATPACTEPGHRGDVLLCGAGQEDHNARCQEDGRELLLCKTRGGGACGTRIAYSLHDPEQVQYLCRLWLCLLLAQMAAWLSWALTDVDPSALPHCCAVAAVQLRATMQQDLQNMKAVFRQTVFEKAPGARS